MIDEPELLAELRRCNDLMERRIAQTNDWRLAIRNGVAAGLGGILGATIVVTILLNVLKPLQRLEAIGPVLERLQQDLERDRK